MASFEMPCIDMRSDTVSWPTPNMRQAMANADLGDDVFGEDPTVNRLQDMAAEITGKEAALFVSSGTQGNLIAILTHCNRGDEIILGQAAHTFKWEVGGAAALGGVHPYPIPIQPDGTLALNDIQSAVRNAANDHFPISRLVTLENTNGAVGGIPLTTDYIQSVRDLCDESDLRLHIDGARIFNAAVALDTDVRSLVDPAHSVTFCLSKGLCAPAGSLLCGDADFIRQARKIRKMVGGGMRQVGVLAAAGIVALEEIIPRLYEDHAHARQLAEGLAQIDGIHIDLDTVQSNMMYFSLDHSLPITAPELYELLDERHNIRLSVRDQHTFRAVMHYWITTEHVEKALHAIREILEEHAG